MNKLSRRVVFYLLAFTVWTVSMTSCGSSGPQSEMSPRVYTKGLDKQAKKYFDAGKYHEAYELYTRVDVDRDILMYRGISAHHIGKISESLSDLIESYSLGNKDKSLYLYMGDNYRSQGKFLDAARFYKSYLQYTDHNSPERNETIHKIKRCGFAKDYKHVDQLAFVENLGPDVNSIYDEISPLQSPNSPSKYYFSSNRSSSTGGLRASDGTKDDIYGFYSADIYAVESTNGNWSSVSAIDPLLNSAKDDIIQDFSRGGDVLYYIKSPQAEQGELLTDTFRVNREELIFPQPMECPIVPSLGDRDLRVFNDSIYLFSSKREGGYGGYDIYVTIQRPNSWSTPINLGPTVNSTFDEITPYLTSNGSNLYFSSNRLQSLGGFDIFESQFGLETATWNTPKNLGVPINSPDDDLYFRLASDGLSAMLSSDRINSYGGSFDLYAVYFKNQVSEQLELSYDMPFLHLRDRTNEVTEAPSSTEGEVSHIPEVIEEEPKSDLSKYNNVSTREIAISPLYYQTSENIVTPANLSQLNKLVETLKIFPEVNVEITGHAVKEGLPEFDLYFSIKRAEKVADYLLDAGIAAERIYLRGVGSHYPAVNASNPIQSNKLNRRLDLRLIYPPEIPLQVVYLGVTVPEAIRDNAIRRYQSSHRGLVYKIHLVTTQQMYKNQVVRDQSDVIIERDYDNSNYLYMTGLYNDYSQARVAKSRLSNHHQHNQSTIVPYIDGRPIGVDQASRLKDRYQDLSNYLRYEGSN